jgi:segregation and condensation protein A|nr:segregation and condensation protein [Phenylobacterium sp.]
MSGTFQPNLDFAAAATAAEDGEALIVDIDGYEGPLHVLLALARSQKVDLLKLSVLKLAEQYLTFVQQARRQQFSLAADYLVMAAWLAYLKSRLLLPKPEQPKADEAPAEEIAARLAFRLAKLDAMRNAAEALRTRPQMGRDVFGRGDPEAITVIPSGRIEGDLYSLMSAYIAQRTKESSRRYTPAVPTAYPLEEARDRLRRLLPELERWTPLAGVAPFGPGSQTGAGQGPSRASYVASTLSAGLELVKEGALEARQLEAFADIYLRTRREKAA